MSGTTAIASLPTNNQQQFNNVGINISEKIDQPSSINSQVQMQNMMNEQISSTNIQQQLNQPNMQNTQIQQMPQITQQYQQSNNMDINDNNMNDSNNLNRNII